MIQRRLDRVLNDYKKSLYWLAKEARVSEQALSNFMKGKTKGIEFETLDRICKALKCQPGDLLVYIPDEERHDYKNKGR